MVDVFGGSKRSSRGPRGPFGPAGPRGAKGKPGIDDMSVWMPNTVLNQLREEDEECCFLLTHPMKDIERQRGKGIVKWLTRCKNKKNAVGIYPCEDIEQIPTGQWALDFDDNLYVIEKVTLTEDTPNSYTYFCVTFRLQSEGNNEEDQFIVFNGDSNYQRGVSATNNEIRIWGAKNDKLSYIPI